jgi:hypothetical protein
VTLLVKVRSIPLANRGIVKGNSSAFTLSSIVLMFLKNGMLFFSMEAHSISSYPLILEKIFI